MYVDCKAAGMRNQVKPAKPLSKLKKNRFFFAAMYPTDTDTVEVSMYPTDTSMLLRENC